jgi:chromosome segregation ATPase
MQVAIAKLQSAPMLETKKQDELQELSLQLQGIQDHIKQLEDELQSKQSYIANLKTEWMNQEVKASMLAAENEDILLLTGNKTDELKQLQEIMEKDVINEELSTLRSSLKAAVIENNNLTEFCKCLETEIAEKHGRNITNAVGKVNNVDSHDVIYKATQMNDTAVVEDATIQTTNAKKKNNKSGKTAPKFAANTTKTKPIFYTSR